MDNWVIIFLILFCIIVNIPFGVWRSMQRKFSLNWFIAVHAPVLLVIALRLMLNVKLIFIPIFIIASVLGQFIGGKIKRKPVNKK